MVAAVDVHDLVLRGARTIDPETGLDAVCDVAVDGATITAVAEGGDHALRGHTEVDVSGLVLAPGFIDMHSHCRDYASRALQVCDGVTTALELEGGEIDVADAYLKAAAEGSPNHFGFSASWAVVRMAVCGLDVRATADPFMEYIGDPGWHRALSRDQTPQLLEGLRRELADGALGIGVLLGYCQEASADEYLSVAGLAAELGTATFTHVRELARPDSGIFGAAEAVTAALATGAHMHICHVNSTSTRNIDHVNEAGRARTGPGSGCHDRGVPVRGRVHRNRGGVPRPDALTYQGLEPGDIRYLPTGERVSSVERLNQLRATDPGGIAVIDFLRESDPDDLGYLMRAFLTAGTAVASDAMPLVPASGDMAEPIPWPVPPDVLTHPRTAGTFSRVLRWYVRELGLLDLPEAIRRCTLVPADILRDIAPDMARKGRIQVGADADLVVFDPETITDRATYDEPTLTSAGIHHVFVSGVPVVRDGTLLVDARPGRPVRGAG